MSDISQGEAFDIAATLKKNHPKTYAKVIKAVVEDAAEESNPIPKAKLKEMEARYKKLQKCKPITINFRGLFAVEAEVSLCDEEFELDAPREGSISLLPEKVTRVQVSKLLEIIDNMVVDGDADHWQTELQNDLEGSDEYEELVTSLSDWFVEAWALQEEHDDFDVLDITG